MTWKILHGRILVDCSLQRQDVQLCSKCSVYCSGIESIAHLFLECIHIRDLWQWILGLFHLQLPFNATLEFLISSSFIANLSKATKHLWYIVFCNLLWCIWMERNRLMYDEEKFCFLRFKQFFFLSFKESAIISFVPCSSTTNALPIFNVLGLSP